MQNDYCFIVWNKISYVRFKVVWKHFSINPDLRFVRREKDPAYWAGSSLAAQSHCDMLM